MWSIILNLNLKIPILGAVAILHYSHTEVASRYWTLVIWSPDINSHTVLPFWKVKPGQNSIPLPSNGYNFHRLPTAITLSGHDQYSIILLWPTPKDFTRQREASCPERVIHFKATCAWKVPTKRQEPCIKFY